MLATTPALFALSYVAVFDMMFTAFLFGGFACLLVAILEERPALQWAGYVLLGLAVLTKGPVAIVLVVMTAVLGFTHRPSRAALRQLRWVAGGGVVALITLPWFVWMWVRFGRAFVDGYVLYGNIYLFAAPLYRQRFSPFFYFRIFLTAFLPWSPIVLGRIVDVIRSRTRWDDLDRREVLLWAWVVAVIGFFSLSRFKLDTYIFPAAPAACILASLSWQHLSESRNPRAYAFTRLSVVFIACVLLAAAILTAQFMFAIDLRLPRSAIMLPIALLVGSLVFGGRLVARRFIPAPFHWELIGTMVAVYAIVVGIGFPALERTLPTRRIAQWVVANTTPHDELGLYRLRKWEASLRFYAGRPVRQVEDEAGLSQWLSASPRAYCVMLEGEYLRLRESNLPLRVVHAETAVVGTSGRGFRRQRWGPVLVVTKD
jgi:4-amino-4-deoxy-L-arabinose transferase-like glycosyltransferase